MTWKVGCTLILIQLSNSGFQVQCKYDIIKTFKLKKKKKKSKTKIQEKLYKISHGSLSKYSASCFRSMSFFFSESEGASFKVHQQIIVLKYFIFLLKVFRKHAGIFVKTNTVYRMPSFSHSKVMPLFFFYVRQMKEDIQMNVPYILNIFFSWKKLNKCLPVWLATFVSAEALVIFIVFPIVHFCQSSSELNQRRHWN